MQGTVQRERPLGVTILAILALIGGFFGLLGGIALLGLGGLAAGLGAAVDGTYAMIIGLGLLVQAVLNLAFGIGAFMLKPWAWTLGVVAQVLGLLLTVLNVVLLRADLGGQIVGVLISIAILYYLFTPGVRAAFGKA